MKDANQKSNLVMNFQEVFGLPYHKTTFAKYKGWIESDDEVIQDIIEAFVSEGAVDDCLWPAFADAVKDRIVVLGKEEARENQMDTRDILDDVNRDDAKSTSGSEDSFSLCEQNFQDDDPRIKVPQIKVEVKEEGKEIDLLAEGSSGDGAMEVMGFRTITDGTHVVYELMD